MKIQQAVCALSLALLAGIVHAEEMNISDQPENRPVDDTPKLAFGQMIRYGEKTVFSPCRDRSFVYFEDVSADGHVGKELDRRDQDSLTPAPGLMQGFLNGPTGFKRLPRERGPVGHLIGEPQMHIAALDRIDETVRHLLDHGEIHPGHVVADIALVGERLDNRDGSCCLKIEALTLAD